MPDPRFVLAIAAAAISLVVAVQFLAAVRRTSWKSPPTVGPARALKISVVMPARNEEEDLAQSIESVLAQEDVELEVIVVNDHSTDRTGPIADATACRDGRVRVIHDPELPPGWLGKCNAMQQAARIATGEIFLFTDGDIIHSRRCFATGLAELERRDLDFLSLFPRMHCISLWENIIVPSLIGGVAMLATPGIEDPGSSEALAAGAFLMVRAPVFRAIGGFESIRGEMVDDLALARSLKANGYRVGLKLAPEFLEVRLFKSNRHAFWGMTKNILVGLQGRFWLAPAVMVLPMFVFWTPIYCAIAGLLERNASLALAGAAGYVIPYASMWSGRRFFPFHRLKALLFPLVVIPIFCCMSRALYLYLVRGEVAWRGRTIRVRQSPAAE